jgi:hypothetical protein
MPGAAANERVPQQCPDDQRYADRDRQGPVGPRRQLAERRQLLAVVDAIMETSSGMSQLPGEASAAVQVWEFVSLPFGVTEKLQALHCTK